MSATETRSGGVMDRISYGDLYRRWEEGNWSPRALDLSADRVGWESLSEIQRASAMWTYSMFLYGEDSVTDNLSPYIEAAPTEEQTYFLATQQADEARHAVFFSRFFEEVIQAGDSPATALQATESHLNWGYRRVFGRLDRMADELRADQSLPKFAQAICMYHFVVEATLAQPGQHFIEDFFAEAGTMPGFSAGMENVSRDEQRHIAFGTKTLADCFAASDECKDAVAELLRDVFPEAIAVYIPPGWDRRYTREYGFELEDIYAYAIRSVKSRLRAAGYPIEDMPAGTLPLDPDEPEEESARRVLGLVHAGVLGEPQGRPGSSPEIQRDVFDMVARAADPGRVDGRAFSVQWRFRDASPWHLRLKDGTAHAEPGEAHDADVTLESDWATWVALLVGRLDAPQAVLRGRLRPHGSPAKLLRLVRMFPRIQTPGLGPLSRLL